MFATWSSTSSSLLSLSAKPLYWPYTWLNRSRLRKSRKDSGNPPQPNQVLHLMWPSSLHTLCLCLSLARDTSTSLHSSAIFYFIANIFSLDPSFWKLPRLPSSEWNSPKVRCGMAYPYQLGTPIDSSHILSVCSWLRGMPRLLSRWVW